MQLSWVNFTRSFSHVTGLRAHESFECRHELSVAAFRRCTSCSQLDGHLDLLVIFLAYGGLLLSNEK
jgi:hypothetical protein